jgi:hypothetical protein
VRGMLESARMFENLNALFRAMFEESNSAFSAEP